MPGNAIKCLKIETIYFLHSSLSKLALSKRYAKSILEIETKKLWTPGNILL